MEDPIVKGPDTTTFLVVLICSILMGVYVKWHWDRRRVYQLMKNIPSPPMKPFFGTAYDLIGDREHIMKKVVEYGRKYGLTQAGWLGPIPMMLVGEPDDLQILLNHPQALDKSFFTKMIIKPSLGDGILIAHPKKWKPTRKLVATTFSKPILDSFHSEFVLQSKILVKKIEQHVDQPQGSCDIFDYFTKTALDIICNTAMGVDLNCQTKDCDFLDAANMAMNMAGLRLIRFWYYLDITFALCEWGCNLFKANKIISKFSELVIRNRKQARARSTVQKQEVEDDGIKRNRKAFLDYFMDINDREHVFSDQDLKDEVTTLIFAGFETTSTTLSFMVLMLAIHPEIQDKAYEELYEIFGDSDRDVELEDLPKMQYMEMVIKETLRHFPTIVAFPRKTMAEIKLATCIVPKGIECLVWPSITHKSEKYWKDPDLFDPMRFTPEECAKRHPYSFLPFSLGPRNCLGIKYAYQSLKTQSAYILRSYRFTTDMKMSDLRLEMSISLRSKTGFPVQVHKRESLVE